MTVSRWAAAGALVATLAIGVAVGRFAAPARVVERDHIVTTDREVSTAWRAYVGTTETKVKRETKVATYTRWLPGGIVEQSTRAEEATASETRATVKDEARAETKREQTADVTRERIVETKRPDWLLGAGVGYALDGGPVYGVSVGRRVLGPVYVEATVQRPWAAMVFAKLLF